MCVGGCTGCVCVGGVCVCVCVVCLFVVYKITIEN